MYHCGLNAVPVAAVDDELLDASVDGQKVLHFADILGFPAHRVAGLCTPLGLDKTGEIVPGKGQTQTQPKGPLG